MVQSTLTIIIPLICSEFFCVYEAVYVNHNVYLSSWSWVNDLFKDPTILASWGFAFFGATIIHNFFAMSFLGLYGVFICQVTVLFFLWFTLCLNMENILFLGKTAHVVWAKWFVLSPHTVVYFEFYFDIISLSFAILTTTIALFVLVYAFTYFRYEPNVDRLILLLSAFVWSMVLLVLSGNLFMLLLGWELIGLTSFLLINFWATRAGTFKAAFKAFTFNKFSDAALILAVIVLSLHFHNLTIPTLLVEAHKSNLSCMVGSTQLRIIEIIACAIFIAASIKSAQLIGHLWLPDSMEAPVPASALIHSATLVSAGIFLILRLHPLLSQSWIFMNVMPILGAATAAYGAACAAYQSDSKRLLAYSTISHCGFLMLLTTMGSIEYTLVYLYIHGFFKALAFLCVGNIIRFSKNYQDLRRMGNFWKLLPAESILLPIALLNLSGAPFFWGFICKHFIVASIMHSTFESLVWALALFGALLGPFYSYRLIAHIFFDTTRARKSVMLAPARNSMISKFNVVTPAGGLISIFILGFIAYFFTFLLVYSLGTFDALLTETATLFSIDQYANTNSFFFGSLLNTALFNWIGFTVWLILILTRWGREYNAFKVFWRFSFFIASVTPILLLL